MRDCTERTAASGYRAGFIVGSTAVHARRFQTYGYRHPKTIIPAKYSLLSRSIRSFSPGVGRQPTVWDIITPTACHSELHRPDGAVVSQHLVHTGLCPGWSYNNMSHVNFRVLSRLYFAEIIVLVCRYPITPPGIITLHAKVDSSRSQQAHRSMRDHY